MELCRLTDVMRQTVLIFPATTIPVEDIVAYSNDKTTYANPAFRTRAAEVNSIQIGRMPVRTTLHGGRQFAMSVGGTWIAESIPHYHHDQIRFERPDITSEPVPIEDECFLATRFGHGPWGHWLDEIFPLVAVTERMYPGRFRYATTYYGAETAWYGSRIVECFAAYGISENRLFRLAQNRNYMFSSAYAMTAAWSDHILHPDVATVMRGSVRLGASGEPRRVALVRRGTRIRALINSDSVEAIFSAYGYLPVDIEALPFVEQASVFRGAESVFSVLGSGLAGLIYAPDFVTVGTLRPQQWQDRFFTALVQLRRGRWADVSGPTRGDNPMGDPFSVPEEGVEAGSAGVTWDLNCLSDHRSRSAAESIDHN